MEKSQHVKIAESLVKQVVLYKRVPVIRAGFIICDDEHWQGIQLNENLKNTRAGVYTTIFKDGKIRGQLGTVKPTMENLAGEILRTSLGAAFQDVRFDPVLPEELHLLSYKICVLGRLNKISGKQAKTININTTGLYLECGCRQFTKLPLVLGQPLVSSEQFLNDALEESNIQMEENPDIYSFEVELFE